MGGLCSSKRSSGYRTGSAGDDGGDSAGGSGGGGHDERKAGEFTTLQGLHSDSVTCVAHCGTEHPFHVASAGLDKHIIINNWQTGEVVAKWRAHDKAVNRLVFASSINTLFSCSRDLSIRLWRVGSDTPLATLTGHTTNVAALDVSTDNTTLCSGARDTSVRVWDIAAAKQTYQAQRPRNLVTCMRYIPGEPCFAQGAEDLAVRVWDARSGALRAVQTFGGYTYFPLDIDVSSDGNHVLTSSKGFNSVGCELRVWDRRAGKMLHEYRGHKQDAVACRFLRDAAGATTNRFMSASKDLTVRVWRMEATGSALCQRMEYAAGMFTNLQPSAAPAVNSGVHMFASSFGGGVFAYGVDEAGNITTVARTPPEQEGRIDA